MATSDEPLATPADSMSDWLDAVERLAQTARRFELSRLRVSVGDAKIEIEINQRGDSIAAPVEAASPGMPPIETTQLSGSIITAPMIGTFYQSAASGDPAFVHVGDVVETGQVVAIIEAMKIMNEIACEQSGVITEILVGNGQPVEFGQALFRLALLEEGLA